MNDLVEFLTSKTGIFAAIAAVVGLTALVASLLRPWWEARRQRRSERADVKITRPVLSDLSRSSNSYELRFEVTNVGGRPAVAVGVQLRVLSHAPSTTVVPTVHEAPLRVNQHRVRLIPEEELYDVRARAYGPKSPPLSLAEAEVEVFIVKLVADTPQQYRLTVEVNWFDAKEPESTHTAVSVPVEADFPPRKSIGPPPLEPRL
jgi:FtsZ-interacting cell division protein ZipA